MKIVQLLGEFVSWKRKRKWEWEQIAIGIMSKQFLVCLKRALSYE